MGLKIEGTYYKKATDAGHYVPPSVPSDEFRKNYDSIRWDKPKENTNGEKEKP
jgi:hypothetical protein